MGSGCRGCVPNGQALSRACELASKERIVRDVGYGLSLEGASAVDLVKNKANRAWTRRRRGSVLTQNPYTILVFKGAYTELQHGTFAKEILGRFKIRFT